MLDSRIVSAPARTADEPIPIDSIRRRYLATLVAQGLQLAASVVTAGVVPRVLGAATYGNYSFLMNMSASLRGFTEPSAQQAFFTFSSQEEESGSLTRLYAVWLLVQLFLLVLLVVVVAASGWMGGVWPGQRLDQIVLITVVDWTAFLALSLKQLGDSKGLTVRPQMIGVAAAATSLAGVLVLAALHSLTFYTYAWLNLVTAGGTAAALGHWLLVIHGGRCWQGSVTGHAASYLRRWWTYARPLILVEYYAPLVALVGTYLIQRWYGSVEQGQFALATRWSAIVLLFTSSAVAIVWREIAAATAAKEFDRAGQFYRRANQPLVFIAVVLSTWLALASPTLVPLLAGPQYASAIPAVMVMAFYPLAQTIGQLSTAGLKAAGCTGEYQKWVMRLSVPDLALTFALVAPTDARIPGLGLGALGIAIKMTGFALVTVQVYEWTLMRHFGLSYRHVAAGHARTLAVVGVVAFATMPLLAHVLEEQFHARAVPSLAVTSVVYFLTTSAIVWSAPQIVGFSRSELAGLAGKWLD